jgi:hypothetical protein
MDGLILSGFYIAFGPGELGFSRIDFVVHGPGSRVCRFENTAVELH